MSTIILIYSNLIQNVKSLVKMPTLNAGTSGLIPKRNFVFLSKIAENQLHTQKQKKNQLYT